MSGAGDVDPELVPGAAADRLGLLRQIGASEPEERGVGGRAEQRHDLGDRPAAVRYGELGVGPLIRGAYALAGSCSRWSMCCALTALIASSSHR